MEQTTRCTRADPKRWPRSSAVFSGRALPALRENRAERQNMRDEQNAKRQVRDAEAMPEWKKNSVERSLTSARERAQDRSDRFVAAALELMQERGTTDFTVQEVIDRSRMSI